MRWCPAECEISCDFYWLLVPVSFRGSGVPPSRPPSTPFVSLSLSLSRSLARSRSACAFVCDRALTHLGRGVRGCGDGWVGVGVCVGRTAVGHVRGVGRMVHVPAQLAVGPHRLRQPVDPHRHRPHDGRRVLLRPQQLLRQRQPRPGRRRRKLHLPVRGEPAAGPWAFNNAHSKRFRSRKIPQILIRQREASPPLVQQSRAPTTRRRRGPCRSRAYANSPRGRRRQVPQFICPVGSYCPDGVTPTACPAGTTSIAGAVHPTDCFSQAGQSKTGARARDPYLAALNAHQHRTL